MIKFIFIVVIISFIIGKIIDMKVKRNTRNKFLTHIINWKCKLCGQPMRLMTSIFHDIWLENMIESGHAHSIIEWRGRKYIHVCRKKGIPNFKPSWDVYNKIFSKEIDKC